MITPKHIIKKFRKIRVRKSVRKNLSGSSSRPRMIIVKTNKYLYTQVIDDETSNILASASTLEKELKSQLQKYKNKDAAKLMGQVIARRLKEKKIKKVAFDRNIYPFMGRVKVFADSARENGIQF
ncbi:MAG: 50S ribosomal protein L18 [Candidatus Aminicenantes bacterium]|nr:50S ribosomal protein L18 [Candidatus Aminicenantes bacterium]